MKVKELVEKLKKLDQNKVIKLGYCDCEYGNLQGDIDGICVNKSQVEIDEDMSYIIAEEDFIKNI